MSGYTVIKDPAPCSNPVTCPGGNCVGCAGGRVNCGDPRCFPYCHGCRAPPHRERNANTAFSIVALCLFAIMLLLLMLYSARFFQRD